MKAKGLIVIGAILMMVIAVGCSNSRTTAPVASNDQLTITSDANNGRFDNSDPGTPVITNNNPNWITLRGNVIYMGSKCTTLRVANTPNGGDYIELSFASNSPTRLPNGTLVQVIGNFNITDDSRCQIYKVFHVYKMSVLTQ